MANRMNRAIARGIAGAREIRTQPYWETKTVAATTDVSFFTSLPATAAAGNLQTAAQLPSPRQYLTRGISVYVGKLAAAAGATLTAVISALNACFIFSISDKEYLRFLGWMAPGGGGAYSTGILATDSLTQNGWPVAGNYLKLAPAILIPQQQNFRVVMTAIAASPAAEVTVALWGTEERAVQ